MAARKKKAPRKKVQRKKRAARKLGDDACVGLAPLWKKGQSGNPGGSSKKARRKKMLKGLLNDAVNIEVPEEWRGQLNELVLNDRLGVLIEEGETIGGALAAKIAMSALKGDEGAIGHILSSEPKAIAVDLPEGSTVVVPTNKKRIKEVTEILKGLGVLE